MRHASFEQPVVYGPLGKLLATVVGSIAHPPVRRRGTFCGSIALADPASEWRTVSLALAAEIIVRSQRGTRIIAASDELTAAAIELYSTRPDKSWTLTDCASFVVMHREGIREALTGDRHFEQAGFVALLK